jgi:hypothetical protein
MLFTLNVKLSTPVKMEGVGTGGEYIGMLFTLNSKLSTPVKMKGVGTKDGIGYVLLEADGFGLVVMGGLPESSSNKRSNCDIG